MTEKSEENAHHAASKDEPVGTGQIIDMKEAVRLLDTTRSTFYRWLRQGKIKGMKVGRQWRFYREDIERFLKGQEPRIDLPADIGPLINELRERAEDIPPPDASPEDPVMEAVRLMIVLADRMNASDIHLAPHLKEGVEGSVAVLRYRVDGALLPITEIDMRLLPAIIERWKAMAACDVHEKERPQDSRIMMRFDDDRKMELRVSFLPTGLGESLTARVIASAPWYAILKLDDIGFARHDRERVARWIEAPWGMIVVSGPTGSGKTTVLYACLNHIAGPDIKVLTVEGPVEYFMPWAVQVQVRPGIGLTFPAALRAVLRSDPDVIMIGQVRDAETLSVAQECALTGHLVMTTMHTNESTAALKRMVDLGSDLHIMGESTKLIIAQRLVRKLCPDCSMERTPSADSLDRISKIARRGGLDWDSLPSDFREPVGCSTCRETGYRGRTIIAETLEVTPEIISALARGAPSEELRTIAVDQGMISMTADGIRRAAMGQTSIAEVMRVAGKLM